MSLVNRFRKAPIMDPITRIEFDSLTIGKELIMVSGQGHYRFEGTVQVAYDPGETGVTVRIMTMDFQKCGDHVDPETHHINALVVASRQELFNLY